MAKMNTALVGNAVPGGPYGKTCRDTPPGVSGPHHKQKEQEKITVSLRGAKRRTPGWLLLPFGQFTFWQSPGFSGRRIGAPFYLRDCHTSVRTGSQ